MIAALPADTRRRYDGLIGQGERLARDGLSPQAVAAVVAVALTTRRPRTRYVAGREEARAQALLARSLPDRALDVLVQRASNERVESPAG